MSSKNLLDKLLEEGKIKKQDTDFGYLNSLLNAAHKNFLSAEYNFKGGFTETAFKSAYDRLLQISRVVIFLNGYKPDDGEQHKTTFFAAGFMLGNKFDKLIEIINRYRVQRNNLVYRPIDFISKKEAAGILESSRKYWLAVKKYLKENSRQLELFDF